MNKPIDLSSHPILQQAFDVIQAIEKCGASVELTSAVTKAGKLMTAINELIAIRELKGDQVPYAYSYNYAGCETCEGFQDWRKELSSESPPEWMVKTGKVTGLVELFTAPQKPVVHPDSKRMDWLCAHVVQVRQPLPYGSHEMFYGQCDSDDCEEYHSTLREQVDAAIEAAGGKVAE